MRIIKLLQKYCKNKLPILDKILPKGKKKKKKWEIAFPLPIQTKIKTKKNLIENKMAHEVTL